MLRAILVGLIIAVLVSSPALARCIEYPIAKKHLLDNYGEISIGIGITGGGSIIEMFVNEEKRTWTIVKTDPNGIACLLAAGTEWEPILPVLGEKS